MTIYFFVGKCGPKPCAYHCVADSSITENLNFVQNALIGNFVFNKNNMSSLNLVKAAVTSKTKSLIGRSSDFSLEYS